jgi:hypothetical protein
MASISGVSSASWPSSTYPPSSPSTSPTFSSTFSSSSTVPYIQCCPDRRLKEPARCCTHLASFKAAGGMESLHAVLQLLNAWKLGLVKKPRPLQFRCAVCGDYNGRLHVCCHCVHIACWDRRHIHEHFLSTKQAHYLGKRSFIHLPLASMLFLHLFCFKPSHFFSLLWFACRHFPSFVALLSLLVHCFSA